MSFAGTWPEQDAVEAWLRKHGLWETHNHAAFMELTEAVTKPRSEALKQMEAMAVKLGHLKTENDGLHVQLRQHVNWLKVSEAEAQLTRQELGKSKEELSNANGLLDHARFEINPFTPEGNHKQEVADLLVSIQEHLAKFGYIE